MGRELKRREKQRAKEASKANKVQTAAPTGAAEKSSAGPSDDDLNPNVSHLSVSHLVTRG